MTHISAKGGKVKALLHLGWLLAMPIVGESQSQAYLRVVDLDGIPIPYAMVTVQGAVRSSDTTGRVLVAEQRALTVEVGVRRMGYVPFAGVAARESTADNFTVVLQPVQRELEAVRTIAPKNTPLSRTGFYDRMERVQKGAILGEFITPEELELRGRGGVLGVFYGKQYAQPAGRGKLSGRRHCKMQILLDGMLIVEHDNLEELISINEVMGIEIYPSTANAPHELIPNTLRGSCGIVALWTGPRR